MVLPVSNLTNLLAFAASGLSFTRFAAVMALPWVVSIAAEYAIFRRFFATDLDAGAQAPATDQAPELPVFVLAVVGCTLGGFVLTSAVGVNPAWAALVGAVVLGSRALVQRRTTSTAIVRSAAVPFIAFVIAWIVEGTWPACVGAVRAHAPEGAEVVLLHVSGQDVPGAAHGAYAGLLGRGGPERDPGTRLEHLAAASAQELLRAAAERLGRPCTVRERTGRIEREVVGAAEGAGLLILARDGDRAHLGPRSLGPASRFVVDHAPCPVLLVWPEPAPGVASIPPPSPSPHEPHR